MGKCNKNILVLTYWAHKDALIQTYTLPYVQLIENNLSANSKIFLLTVENNRSSSIPDSGKIQFIPLTYHSPGLMAAWQWIRTIIRLLLLIKKENISTIHAWCTPAGMIGYIVSVLSGKELIIDSFEPHAEAMVENGEWKKNSMIFKLLFRFEKLQAHRAKYLIAVSDKMKEYAALKYNLISDNYFVKPACVNLDLFSFGNRKKKELLQQYGLENKIVCVYAGKFGGIYLDKEIFSYLKVAQDYWGDRLRVLLLSSDSDEKIEKLRIDSGVKKETIIKLFVPHAQIADYLGLGDFALTPVKPIPTKRYCSPIKDGEYWALGLPVVITKNISDDSAIISHYKIGSIIESFHYDSLLQSVKEIDEMLRLHTTHDWYLKIRPIAEKYRNFSIASEIYSRIYS